MEQVITTNEYKPSMEELNVNALFAQLSESSKEKLNNIIIRCCCDC